MNKILQFSTYGIKNIEKMITVDFANQTIEKGISKINNVKGIFGYNGAGKSAIITSIDFYNKIVCNPNYLLQNDTKDELSKLINYVRNEFYISTIFEYEKGIVIRHIIKLVKDEILSDFVISEESISLSMGRTLNDKFKSVIEKADKGLYIDEKIGNTSRINYDCSLNDLKYNSIIQYMTQKMIDYSKENNDNKGISLLEKIILSLYLDVNNILVYMQDSDMHKNYKIDENIIIELMNKFKKLKVNLNESTDIYSIDAIIPKHEYIKYEEENKKLERFIKFFKPDLKEIKLIVSENRDVYNVRKLFVYDKYRVELEYESSGIKQLVKLYSYLEKCANGRIVFIDEIDTNINAVYFEKLISFFKNYGKGQLIFTTHNIEAMKALKNQSRAIVVLGVDNKLDTWVGKGNKSPINDYINGDFPNSPMNIEDFDFINIFIGDEE